jgi:hypothetical protein
MNARVTVLRDPAQEPAESGEDTLEEGVAEVPNGFEADVTTLEVPFMELSARETVKAGAALRIDTIDAVWLAEAESCTASGDSFTIRVRLRHVLRDFDTLARLAERFGTRALKGNTVRA